MTSSQAADRHIIVIGAGVGGLAAAIDLAAGGARVTLIEKHDAPGGKMREVVVDGQGIDSGPTVFTMRWVFEELFTAAGLSLQESVALQPADVLARHSWLDGSQLDLYADVERSAAAIAELAGRGEADAYRRFARESQRIYDTLDHSFMRIEKPGPVTLAFSHGVAGLRRLYATKPFRSLWTELGRIFSDPRLRQLFGRYATYCGSSPFAAPATLMLIAHAERAGVWYVEGGMQRFAECLAAAASTAGAGLHYGQSVARINTQRGRVSGVELEDGTTLDADAVVFNGDVAALADGLLGDEISAAVQSRSAEPRSLSAITWSLLARSEGFPLSHHTVFFGDDYADEFASIFERDTITRRPTIYVCAQDRGTAPVESGEPERLFLLANAPPRPCGNEEVERAAERVFEHLESHGCSIAAVGDPVVTTPNDYANRFPASDGAIYGWPTHGWSGSFRRGGSRSKIPGLYLAGGTVHPGPGVPMTAISGRIAAASVREDLERR